MTNNATKKQLYQEKRQQKFEAKEKAHKETKKDNTLLFVAILVPLVLIGGIIAYGFYAKKPLATKEIGEFFPDQGRTHIKVGETHPAYNSNPPTSGWHYDNPVDWGVYKNEQVEERLVHNLEHGGIVIQYKPTLDSASIAKLEELKRLKFECKLVIAPFSKLDKTIALTAWRRLYKSDKLDEQTVKEFIQEYHDRAPESVSCTQ